MIFQYLLESQLFYEYEKQQWSLLLCLHLITSDHGMVKDIDLQSFQIINAHTSATESRKKLGYSIFELWNFMLMMFPCFVSHHIDITDIDFIS